MKHQEREDWERPIKTVAREDVTTLDEGLTVQEALDVLRERGVSEKIVYFYVVNQRQELTGVVPTRRLLSAALDERVSSVMVRRVMSIPETATVLEACEAFVLHKFLALPVVDYRRRIVGVVDLSLVTDQLFDVAERTRVDEMFEVLGFHVSQVRDASPLRGF